MGCWFFDAGDPPLPVGNRNTTDRQGIAATRPIGLYRQPMGLHETEHDSPGLTLPPPRHGVLVPNASLIPCRSSIPFRLLPPTPARPLVIDSSAPSFLRIHRGPASSASNSNSSDSGASGGSGLSGSQQTVDIIESFWETFQSATGWQLAPRSRRIGGQPILVPTVNAASTQPIDLTQPVDLGFDRDQDDDLDDLVLDSLTRVSAVGKADATDMAAAATELISDLNEARQAISRQHAEMAARANVVVGDDHQADLASKLNAILADASEACGCDAAAIYMLDDDTSELQIRSVYGLPQSRLTAGPRSLQGARGDLEAMVKNVVTIDDLQTGPLDTWNAPEEAAAGICAVICAADIPIGTVWFFADDAKPFGPAQAAAARMAAKWIQVELASAENSGWKSQPTTASTTAPSVSPSIESANDNRSGSLRNDEVRDVAQWQFQALPIGAEIAEDWKADGMIESPHNFAIGWHTWDVLPDGSISMAIAEAVAADITGAMNATVARAALAAHSGYRHTPAQILSRIGDTLWQTSLGEQLMSMMYVRVDPETGEGEIASAGLITAMIASRFGYRPVVSGQSDPLCSHIDTRSVQETFRLTAGEALLAYSPGMISPAMTHTTIGGLLHDAMKQANPSPLATVRRALAKMPFSCERGASVLIRG